MGYGANPQRLAFVATAGAASSQRQLFSMPAAPSTAAAEAVGSVGSGASPVILTSVHFGAYAADPALLVAYGSDLHLVVGVTPCKLQLNVSVGPAVSATTALDGSLFFTAQALNGFDDNMRVWRIPAAAVAAGLCGATVPVVRVRDLVPLSTLSECGGGLTVVGTADDDSSTVRLWSIAPSGQVSSLPVGADGVIGAPGVAPRLACIWGKQISGMVLSTEELAFMSIADGIVATASPATQAPFATARSLIAVGDADMVCFVADTVPASSHSALFCWTQAGGVVRAAGATVPAATNLVAQYNHFGSHRAFMPCTLTGAATGSLPRQCAYDSVLGQWLAVVEAGTLAPVFSPYSSGTSTSGAAFFAGMLAGACPALWRFVS